ncbi:hypothetical protein, partial [Enterococcus faecalis]|uniref:hypothetical protein n=1 Tax=Enterococcus faecalis TaxID=1351 RepID=UPI00398779A4
AHYEKEIYHSDWPNTYAVQKQAKDLNKKAIMPTARPTPPNNFQGKKPAGSTSFCPEVWKELGLSFPVFLDANGQRHHEPVDFKTIKQLTE